MRTTLGDEDEECEKSRNHGREQGPRTGIEGSVSHRKYSYFIDDLTASNTLFAPKI